MSDVESKIYDIIVEKTNIDRAKLTREASLSELEISSLDFVEIVFAVEEEFDIEVPYNANTQDQDFKALGDIVGAVEKLVEERG
ncbi:acyl carrier protein [Rhodospirillum rubrum]|uniref:Acyl carrier protein n=1 Tax=Rhodospirillum rubrum (strain ATCC 11170 / ATH 1.1.1 / DSM 467 / LMG 4362 / NCIMB 8255 / S1) TaxID=269796 RepID=Q2RYE6_RHORT|nr:acyl carrier protein [Rhodospirillum rubrum]ABC20849.1 acyl carrier protein [Rhodospirillum rubrum ATCC 11170]AEO46516.1 acyl carrier protein [Rhodospirillum rubrum F11]MBK1665980.1 acyl carrier protein [Rhodospirillum rubrum]MBK1677947.1 acyl carrier protein [Rhodospirillum rubrum]MBK5952405.1 acyl carrier protein [Rhodospirillum rubrum]